MRPYKTLAIVGSGPAGISTASELLRLNPDTRIDVYEKLPVPYTLIRYGVAPDNLGAKNAINLYNKVLSDERVKLLANVEIGKHVSYKELLKCYDAVVIAVGVNSPRTPPDKYLLKPNVFMADSFVKWYNGHPQFINTLNPDLTAGENMVILGHGNVSFDIARIMLTHIDILKTCDIPSSALEVIKKSNIRHARVIGRRGLDAVKFTAKEVRSVADSPYINMLIKDKDYVNSFDSEQVSLFGRPIKMLYDALRDPQEKSLSDNRVCELVFFSRIRDVITDESSGKLVAVEMEKNFMGHSEVYSIPCDLLIFSYGYEPSKLEDIRLGQQPRIENSGEDSTCVEGGNLPPNLFVSGFRKITFGYNIPNTIKIAKVTAHEISEYFKKIGNSTQSSLNSEKYSPRVIENKIRDIGVKTIDYKGWLEVNNTELIAGRILGKAREKIVTPQEIISVAKK